MNWLLLILSLPTENATPRMRAWRALKALGAGVLRDGVYVLPARDDCAAAFEGIAADVRTGGGVAHLLRAAAPQGAGYEPLFDRSAGYAALVDEVAGLRAAELPAADLTKRARRLRRMLMAVRATDYFPGEAGRQADAAVSALEHAAARALAPDEPHPAAGELSPLRSADYRGRTWVTRRRPWADRLACAWLVRRHIDRQAKIRWLARPAAGSRGAVGFDFDGAEFSHVGARVTFEVMLARFGLEQPALQRLGAIVHCLDVGGIQPPEAGGVEAILTGLRESIPDDDRLLAAAGAVFDGLVVAFEKDGTPR